MIQNDIVTNYLSMKNTRNFLKAFIDICNKVFFQVIIYKKKHSNATSLMKENYINLL